MRRRIMFGVNVWNNIIGELNGLCVKKSSRNTIRLYDIVGCDAGSSAGNRRAKLRTITFSCIFSGLSTGKDIYRGNKEQSAHTAIILLIRKIKGLVARDYDVHTGDIYAYICARACSVYTKCD